MRHLFSFIIAACMLLLAACTASVGPPADTSIAENEVGMFNDTVLEAADDTGGIISGVFAAHDTVTAGRSQEARSGFLPCTKPVVEPVNHVVETAQLLELHRAPVAALSENSSGLRHPVDYDKTLQWFSATPGTSIIDTGREVTAAPLRPPSTKELSAT